MPFRDLRLARPLPHATDGTLTQGEAHRAAGRARRVEILGFAASAIAATFGAWIGYGFGRQIGGWAMGVVTAASTAALAAILTEAAVHAAARWARRR